MEQRTLGRTGFRVSVLGFGAAPIAFLETERDRAATLLNELLDSGVNLIDTAATYPGSEEYLGEHFSHRRKEYVLVSKVAGKNPEGSGPEWSKGQISISVDRSLRFLRTDVIDVMLLHSCDLQTLHRGEALGALIEARDAGKVRFVGYSGDNEEAIWAGQHPEVAVIETSINIVDQMNIDRVLPVTRKHNVGVIAKRPMANAAWKDLAEQRGMYQAYAKSYTERLHAMKLDAAELGFKGEPSEVWPEIAIRFALSFPDAHTCVLGTTSPENSRQNVAIANKGPLPADTVNKIRAAFHRADPKGEWRGEI